MIDLLTDPQAWASLLTLTLLEIVLGIDNVIFISIVSGRLPEARQPRARRSAWRSRRRCGSSCCSRSPGSSA